MSLYFATLGADDNAVVGFDENLETLFFRSGIERNGEPVHWFGTAPREFLDITILKDVVKQKTKMNLIIDDERSLKNELLRFLNNNT
nr:hypothetical protein [uncultured Pseudogulbenkiania sp.]